jgi:glycosyltransferase involved in cell wall biosynthesis
MSQNPLVSIIVRTKDRPQLIKRALQSIASQTYRPIEVVIVNDGGCDLDMNEIKTILGDAELNYVRLEQNTGRAHAGNVGISHAQGDFIGFLDDDDEFYPEHISELIGFLMDKKADYSGIYSDSIIINREYNSEGTIIHETNKGLFRSWDFSSDILLFENYIPLHCSILLKSDLEEIEGFDESFELFEDWDLFIRITEKKPLYHIAKATTQYIHWSKTEQIAFSDMPEAQDYYLRVLSKHLKKVSPRAIYRYFLFKQEELRVQQSFIEANLSQVLECERLRDKLKAKEDLIMAKLEIIQHLRVKVEKRNTALEAKQSEVEWLKEEVRVKSEFVKELQNSLGWRVLHFYRTTIKKKLFPVGTRRETWYGMFLKVMHTASIFGVRYTVKKIFTKTRGIVAARKIERESFHMPIVLSENVPLIDCMVSVVIPTKNAGSEFRNTLEQIRSQKGIREIELIIIDSGSNDDTLALAKSYGAQVISIRPEEFNHGSTRNTASELARGDYLIFLSQDVIPVSKTCIHDILGVMESDGKIAAATIKQIPRSDADLFACWQLWNHYNKFLCLPDNSIVEMSQKDLAELSPTEKRRVGQLDNIFSCIRRDIFDVFRFRSLSYGEDLDLGLRLLEKGHKLAFLFSLGAIHSHNRNPAYFFRRSYIDWKTLISLLKYKPKAWDTVGIPTADRLFQYIYWFYCRVNTVIREYQDNENAQSVHSVFEGIRQSLKDTDWYRAQAPGEKSIDDLLGRIMLAEDMRYVRFDGNREVLINQYLYLIDSFEEFLTGYADISGYEEEFISALYKFFAIIAGATIGDFAAYAADNTQTGGILVSVHDILGESV